MCTIEVNTGTIAETGPTPYTATTALFPNKVYATQFHRHYSGQQALLNRHFIGATTAAIDKNTVRVG